MTLEMWTDRQDKIQTFFGPGVQADIQKTDQVSVPSKTVLSASFSADMASARQHAVHHQCGAAWCMVQTQPAREPDLSQNALCFIHVNLARNVLGD